MENSKHRGNYTGTTNMEPQNQDMAFVNNTVEEAAEHHLIKNPQLLTETDKADEAKADAGE
ncbi:hypothetical protein SD70_18240 [Gordoniibacillus kamchatkensis]|uniref:DUF4025 domain-containing protein n=1 Tax=Gordoniibacillus kamchatkensis TaxID=1590651 RepID=A0ABR5AGJ9_9BACL|nr:hypothetical protein [Paenibacillus sp. VKM B-2647]KIL39700.1 hypothetical protein SD70_18240 [Paenibacillus sp. VKM B-2647]